MFRHPGKPCAFVTPTRRFAAATCALAAESSNFLVRCTPLRVCRARQFRSDPKLCHKTFSSALSPKEIDMRTSLLALAAIAMAPIVLAAPASGQTRADEIRWQQAQRRFDTERAIFERERERYESTRRGRRGGGGYGGGGSAAAAAVTAGRTATIGSRPAIIATTRATEERRLSRRAMKSIAARTGAIIAAAATAPPASSSAPASAPWSAAASTRAASAPPAPWSAACSAPWSAARSSATATCAAARLYRPHRADRRKSPPP